MKLFRTCQLVLVVLVCASSSFAQGWKPELAATYLDSRQEKWFEWPAAQSKNGPCISCHTGLTYLFARPVLRKSLGQDEPTRYEIGLMERLRSNAGNKPAAALRDVEVIFTALFLAREDSGRKMLSPVTEKAFDQLWALQVQVGAMRGSWKWYNANLNPWETPDSVYYGTALAALAVGTTPSQYRSRPEIREKIDSMSQYLQNAFKTQPIHNRLVVLWASSALPEVLPSAMRQSLIAEVFRAQDTTGAWTMASLGPWQTQAAAPPDTGGSNYASGFVSFVLQQAGVEASDRRMKRALDWLRSRQDPTSGAWTAVSMNKSYPSGSMEEAFMQDAATAYSSAALLIANRN